MEFLSLSCLSMWSQEFDSISVLIIFFFFLQMSLLWFAGAFHVVSDKVLIK